MSSQAFSYDEVIYPSHAYSATHPDRLATIARIFGVDAPPVETARVLEIGCAGGGNIVPMALGLPDARFVGVDLGERQIEEARRLVADLGATNVEVHHLDIRDLDASFGSFDYVLCHGVYSWVPKEAREKILTVCRDNMTPGGVAYVSYNTYPGWHMRGLVRDIMLYHAAHFGEPMEKVRQARALLDFLAEVNEEDSTYGRVLDQEVELLQGLTDQYLFHDHLAGINDPVFFHQFADRAESAGLQYLGEARFPAMLSMNLPEEVQEILDKISPTIIHMEQYMDFVRNRSFRQTLLVHREVEVSREVGWKRLLPFRFGCSAEPTEPDADPASEDELLFEAGEVKMRTAVPIVKAAMMELGSCWPEFVPFEDLYQRARSRLGPVEESDEVGRAEMGMNLLSCFASGAVEVSLMEWPAVRVSEYPKITGVLAHQLAQGMRRVTSALHVSCFANDLAAHLLPLCDGTRSWAELSSALQRLALEEELSVSHEDGTPIDDPKILRDTFDEVVPEVLRMLAREGFFVA